MPNGPTHRKLTKIAACLGTGTLIYLGANTERELLGFLGFEKDTWFLTEISWFFAGVLTTLYFDPDLDLRHRLGYVGNAIGLELYQKLVPHRAGITSKSWREFSKKDWWKLFMFSHLPFTGTLPRLLILVALTAPIYLLFSAIDRYPIYGIMWLYLGMSYSDIWHSTADLMTSSWKQRTKKKDKGWSDYPNQDRARKNSMKDMSTYSKKKPKGERRW